MGNSVLAELLRGKGGFAIRLLRPRTIDAALLRKHVARSSETCFFETNMLSSSVHNPKREHFVNEPIDPVINRVQGVARSLPAEVTDQTEAWSVKKASQAKFGRTGQMVQSYDPAKLGLKRPFGGRLRESRATAASSRAIPFQEPHGSSPPPLP
eukprot:scaffold83611_cov57-Phaeocystis_antarctica.AAC.2